MLDQVEQAYFGQERPEMLAFLPRSARMLLDVGCGQGTFAARAKEALGATVWGIEINAAAARVARTRLDHVLEADVGQALAGLPSARFDCVVFNDVLEHLVDPYSVVDEIKRVLTPGGIVVASLPNVRHFPVAWNLVWMGRWDYADWGVLDRTHLRFFTRHSAQALFEERGYAVEITGINPLSSRLARVAARLAPPRFREMQFQQFAIVARPRMPSSA